MEFFFNVQNNSTEEEMDCFLYTLFEQKIRVVLILDLSEYSESFFNLIKFKKLLDKYREYSREYLEHTIVIINNKLLILILEIILAIFQPERPVLIEFKESD
jgi:hypothetical protein